MPDCLFCRIVAGEIPADIVAENAGAIAFRDLNPVAPTHALVIPRDHLENVAEVAAKAPDTLGDVFNLAAEVAVAEGIAEGGYRLVANTGRDGHQTVFHAHVHVLGGRSMGWPPG
jgi:histidine triad (HIT) family protein